MAKAYITSVENIQQANRSVVGRVGSLYREPPRTLAIRATQPNMANCSFRESDWATLLVKSSLSACASAVAARSVDQTRPVVLVLCSGASFDGAAVLLSQLLSEGLINNAP
jgi:hypothetical protein